MVSELRSKRVFFRRAVFGASIDDNLEALLVAAAKKRRRVLDRTFLLNSGDTVQGSVTRQSRSGGVEIHLTTFRLRDSTSVVMHVAETSTDGEIGVAPPPRDAEYMEREILAVVKDNDVALVCTNCREKPLEDYIWRLLEAANGSPPDVLLQPVANAQVVRRLAKEGVKEVSLNTSLFKATMDRTDRETVKYKLANGILKELLALVGKDTKNLSEEADLTATLTIKMNRWRSGHLAAAELGALASTLRSEESGDYSILTQGGNRFGPDKINLQQTVSLPVNGKSLLREPAWQALREFLKDLRDKGLAQQ